MAEQEQPQSAVRFTAMIFTSKGVYKVKCNRRELLAMPPGAQLDAISQWLATSVIVDWDVKDATGAPVPITQDAITQLGQEFLAKLMTQALGQLLNMTTQLTNLRNGFRGFYFPIDVVA